MVVYSALGEGVLDSYRPGLARGPVDLRIGATGDLPTCLSMVRGTKYYVPCIQSDKETRQRIRYSSIYYNPTRNSNVVQSTKYSSVSPQSSPKTRDLVPQN